MEVNVQRVQRLWRQEGLRVPRRQRKRARLGKSDNGTQRLSAERVNHGWSDDFVFDQSEDGRRRKWLPICDEFSRELVALEVERRMEAKDVIRILEAAVHERGGPPEFIRSDNGPEFVALAVQEWIEKRGFKTLYIKPGAPWQNASSESFKLPVPGRIFEPGSVQRTAGGESARPRTPATAQPPAPTLVTGRPEAGGVREAQPQGCALSPEQPTHNQNTNNHEKLS